MSGQWREIFRAGDYGGKGTYTRADLDSMVANFDKDDRVPIVLGHPEADAPAWGWLSGLRRVGDVLQGCEVDMQPDFVRARDEQRFRNRSVRIARTAQGPKVLHLGYLGATLPEVSGLSQAVFSSASSGESIDFTLVHRPEPGAVPKPEQQQTDDGAETMDDKKRIEQLEADLAAEKQARADDARQRAQLDAERRKADFSAFVHGEMVAKGRLPKARAEEAVAFLCSLPADEHADFSWGEGEDKKSSTSAGWFMDFVRAMPEAEFLRELPGGADRTPDADTGVRIDLTRKI